MKTGRNDPCPCGSGRKFKQCCLTATSVATDPADLAWQRVRRALDGHAKTMTQFTTEIWGADAIDRAWAEFMPQQSAPFDPEGPHTPMFMPWMFHCWRPQGAEPPTRAYLDRRARTIDPLRREYLESCLSSRFSFFEVEGCQPGRGFGLHDLFSGERHEVVERSGSQALQDGDLIYGLLAHAAGVTLVEAMNTFVIPPIHKIDVIRLRQHLRSAAGSPAGDVRVAHAETLRKLYLQLADRILNPPLPVLHNTDGDPLVLHKLVFDVESAQAAFDALKHLDFDAEEAELLAGATRDAAGTLQQVSLAWKRRGNRKHKDWNNTVLAHLDINGRRLTAEVNSEKRAAAFRRLVERAMGERARFRVAEVQSGEKLMSQVRARASSGQRRPAPLDDELQNSPEVRALLDAMVARHYEDWVGQKIPALGGKTPRAAMKTADGREMVEALVRDMERNNSRQPQPVDEGVFRALRERLGLGES